MIKTTLIAAVALAAIAATASAAPDDAGNPAASLSLSQFEARQWNRLAAADTDHDGKISKAEFAASIAGRPNADRADAMFARMDADGDGFISQGEAAKMADRRFDRLDANHDGVVTLDEVQAARQARAAAGQ